MWWICRPYILARKSRLIHSLPRSEACGGPSGRKSRRSPVGRASTIVLAQYPNAFRVRLDGPVEARVRWAMTYEQLDEAAARRAQRETDRLRAAYVRHLYGTATTDPSHFHLYVDVTAIDIGACVDLLEEWVRRRQPIGATSSDKD